MWREITATATGGRVSLRRAALALTGLAWLSARAVIFSAKTSLAGQDHEPPGRQLAVVRHSGGQAQQVGQLGVVGARRGQAHGGRRAPLGQEVQHRLRRFDRQHFAKFGGRGNGTGQDDLQEAR
jgi:hypothetical protein